MTANISSSFIFWPGISPHGTQRLKLPCEINKLLGNVAIGVKRMEYLAVRWRKPFTSTLVTRGSGDFLGFNQPGENIMVEAPWKSKMTRKLKMHHSKVPKVVEV